MNRLFFLLLATSFLLTACVKQQIIDRITLFIVCAFDEATSDQIEFTIAAPKFQSKKPGTVSNQLLSKVAHTSVDIKELMDFQLSRPINEGRLSVILFGKDVAANGLARELDVALRDARASRKMFLAVVDGKAKTLLDANFSSDEEKGLFLFNLLDSNRRNGRLPLQNLHEFEYSNMGKGMDPFLPLLKLQNDQVVITGLALFKDDKYVESINEKQMRLMKLLLKDAENGVCEVKFEDGSYVTVRNLGSKVRYRISKDTKTANLSINLVLKGEIIESRGVHYPKQELEKIKKSLENELTTTGMQLIDLFKTEGIDPLGLGDFARSKTRNWNEEEWKKEYRALNVHLNVKVTLSEIGIKK
ncbi:Ger(x)C family spore germination protein [Paenibacillus radicis (ex Xue et al. 2023)]|uniref:Ger(X)C family spore germination protein n=1 Tax=Paenibacillus radicis (ex Xue et al. 2023) TaxID=2972489 RepID=A0ABT1YAM3_9BACL|nr:Ger(x)C family spore germination protein [Paenibacillus radicis (ex Xue et al. 2023)]MCR8630246.1 Ger(x)C family spore germination protein [Paenibacillus radicis (ex Xue et al. 2023)]